MTRRFKVVAFVETIGDDPDLPPVEEWTGEFVEQGIEEWTFEHLQLESVEEVK